MSPQRSAPFAGFSIVGCCLAILFASLCPTDAASGCGPVDTASSTFVLEAGQNDAVLRATATFVNAEEQTKTQTLLAALQTADGTTIPIDQCTYTASQQGTCGGVYECTHDVSATKLSGQYNRDKGSFTFPVSGTLAECINGECNVIKMSRATVRVNNNVEGEGTIAVVLPEEEVIDRDLQATQTVDAGEKLPGELTKVTLGVEADGVVISPYHIEVTGSFEGAEGTKTAEHLIAVNGEGKRMEAEMRPSGDLTKTVLIFRMKVPATAFGVPAVKLPAWFTLRWSAKAQVPGIDASNGGGRRQGNGETVTGSVSLKVAADTSFRATNDTEVAFAEAAVIEPMGATGVPTTVPTKVGNYTAMASPAATGSIAPDAAGGSFWWRHVVPPLSIAMSGVAITISLGAVYVLLRFIREQQAAMQKRWMSSRP
mmetsp:Transcript_718/g.1883  ORF Transcript_718/g.1883 Transcript_718/m.1883 type:complete len:427 (-) Transcript_718:248-1528(-)